ncbi:DNA-deoxyinosine glycosylase [Plasticicumulans acidivorans]|uniref:G/U mismatch-specific uracil-DNA glycosylase n=1 Tax=Plasticicumulans acidivorans TaxID=886464 RepID=A0A317MYA7_9GAMM|nr:DNA-deoxyinosine glycosylase [Plasticicumulans acidivorans]PWV60501.1 G/U mismatch-specific uracil-DNA glycosylase [Plasticicumulans acidivorans]
MENLLKGFDPIAGSDARALVLGSMPSVASLTAGEYYAHPRNHFWPLMAALYGTPADAPYAERAAALRQAGVAVWDVLAACRREGSLDSAIDPASMQINDFPAFFAAHPQLRHVFFNGTTAETVFRRWVLRRLDGLELNLVRLPSTSPAHAGQTFRQKLAAWKCLASVTQISANN